MGSLRGNALAPTPRTSRGKTRSWCARARNRTPAGAREGPGADGGRPRTRTAGPGFGVAGGNAGAARAGGEGTLRRKLATTCSKGYLYTWRTSTVTPMPTRPAPGSAATAGAHTRPAKGAGQVFFPPFSNFGTLLSSRRNRQAVGPRPLPPQQGVGGGPREAEARPHWSGPRRRREWPAPPRAGSHPPRALRPGPLETCFSVVTSPELLRTQQP